MKISCLKENLSKGLNIVSRLSSTKSTLEILSHILISTENGRLKLSATNLEIGINYKIGAKVEEEGSITVPAKLFTDLVSQLPEGKISLIKENNNILVKAKNYESRVNGLSADDFPLIPKIKDKKSFSLKGNDLRNAISMVSFASAQEEIRPQLAGIFMDANKNKLSLVATDSYRLAEKKIAIEENLGVFKVIVPSRSLVELSKIISESNDLINVYINENQVMFENEDFELISRLVEGNFPDYKHIIPTNLETKAKVNLSDFVNIIKVSALFSGESVGSINVEISPKGRISARSSSSQFGESSSSCEAEVSGKEVEIVFNSKYILDVLANLSGEIEIEVNGKLNPGVIKKFGDNSYIYVIMPLRA